MQRAREPERAISSTRTACAPAQHSHSACRTQTVFYLEAEPVGPGRKAPPDVCSHPARDRGQHVGQHVGCARKAIGKARLRRGEVADSEAPLYHLERVAKTDTEEAVVSESESNLLAEFQVEAGSEVSCSNLEHVAEIGTETAVIAEIQVNLLAAFQVEAAGTEEPCCPSERAVETGSERTAAQKLQATYFADFVAQEDRKHVEHGACGPGCLSIAKTDHLACNRIKVCVHYERNCLLKAACCEKYYPCRKCHDEVEGHVIDRYKTEFVSCKKCGADDVPIGENCSNCHIRFARYYCGTCRFFDDSETSRVYHCDKCNICRVGFGLGIDNVHCDRCETCVPIEVADSHPCLEGALRRNCPICVEDLASSSEQVIYMRCGHAIHSTCFSQHTEHSYTCPICSRVLTDMTQWYRALDSAIAKDQMLPKLASRMRVIYCHDCEVNSNARFHFTYHKCAFCQGYNTRVVSELPVGTACSPLEPAGNDKGDDEACLSVADRPVPVDVTDITEPTAEIVSCAFHSRVSEPVLAQSMQTLRQR
jgi:uncharacterized CHY-type Zn-finger protein